MKSIKFQTKLVLNKETVSNLNSGNMDRIMAGNAKQQEKSDVTINGYTDNCTCTSCIVHICANSEVGNTCVSCETCDCSVNGLCAVPIVSNACIQTH